MLGEHAPALYRTFSRKRTNRRIVCHDLLEVSELRDLGEVRIFSPAFGLATVPDPTGIVVGCGDRDELALRRSCPAGAKESFLGFRAFNPAVFEDTADVFWSGCEGSVCARHIWDVLGHEVCRAITPFPTRKPPCVRAPHNLMVGLIAM